MDNLHRYDVHQALVGSAAHSCRQATAIDFAPVMLAKAVEQCCCCMQAFLKQMQSIAKGPDLSEHYHYL